MTAVDDNDFHTVDDCPCCQQDEAEIPDENAEDVVVQIALPVPFWKQEEGVLQRKVSSLVSIYVHEEDDPPQTGSWLGKLDFVMSCMGYSVGLGNMWRFPYLAYKNGGAIFFLPYFIMLVFVGWPLFFLEMSFGQFSGKSSITIWKASPVFEGIGYAMTVASLLITLYYNVLNGWVIFYLFDSFRMEVPYRLCNCTWNTEHCYRKEDDDACMAANVSNIFYNQTCFDELDAEIFNISRSLINATHRVLPSEEYFKYNVLGLSDGIHGGWWGELRWENTLCLAASWAFTLICLFKSVRTSGKVVYFTATFPYLVLLAFLIRGMMLEGAFVGLRYYLVPDFRRLADPNVWIDAGGQAILSLGVAFGGLITLSSYNRFQNNCLRDAVAIFVADTITSFLSGCAIFAVLGFLAHETGHAIHDVVQAGSGLGFVAYPEAIMRMPLPAFWSVLFFFMLATLGADSVVAILETTSTALFHRFEHLQKFRHSILLGSCLLLFLLGLPLCTGAGLYWFTLLNDYTATWTVLLIALVEDVAIVFVYGVNRLCDDIEMMIGPRPWRRVSVYWKFCWLFSIPSCITSAMVFYWTSYRRTSTEPAFPLWAEIVGWLIALSAISVVPIMLAVRLHSKRGASGDSLFQRLRALTMPTDDWGPAGQVPPSQCDGTSDFHEVDRPIQGEKTEIEMVVRRIHCHGMHEGQYNDNT
ncbi:Sodium- and chloride-dependent glycine transporter 2 [Hypsibius exemplaris]|uniref:Transporter n=1 Tax=Hypsibius exemplaris TaxID=2072580 RepID=A0A9X6NGI4_HYPEX|nr:Sodium- and chloride-dependent glycine transporter 2 [Hypsibius exemplaris]